MAQRGTRGTRDPSCLRHYNVTTTQGNLLRKAYASKALTNNEHANIKAQAPNSMKEERQIVKNYAQHKMGLTP